MVLIFAVLVMFTTVVIVGKLQMRRGEAGNLGSMSRQWVAEYRHASDAAAEKR